MLRAAFIALALSLTLAACYGGGSMRGPGIDLSGPHSSYLSLGGGGPASSSYRGGFGADTVP